MQHSLLEDYLLAENLCNKAPTHQYDNPPPQEFKHAVLGLIALKKNDGKTACERLLSTEEFSPKSSFTIALLEELLNGGNHEIVSGYLERYFKTPISSAEVSLWLEDAKQGLTP